MERKIEVINQRIKRHRRVVERLICTVSRSLTMMVRENIKIIGNTVQVHSVVLQDLFAQSYRLNITRCWRLHAGQLQWVLKACETLVSLAVVVLLKTWHSAQLAAELQS